MLYSNKVKLNEVKFNIVVMIVSWFRMYYHRMKPSLLCLYVVTNARATNTAHFL